MQEVLIIDDDTALTDLLSELLSLEGFSVRCADNGQTGLEMASASPPDIILLDVMMPVLNGMETLRQLRAISNVAILMLTARGEEVDRVMGLELGADDYLAKPFSDRELLARMRAILRRTQVVSAESAPPEDEPVLAHHDVRVYPRRLETLCQDKPVALTGMETEMLACLLHHPGEVVSKALLSEQVLGKRLMPFDRAVDVHISNLRKKLPERLDGKPRIKTLRGKGYLWVD
ncbi:response regulator [Salinivibrio proteolyticus]|uniref:Response regulator n=1 Tax=Salinivibrio proteolyticus TaxID=334715 RepID=A0ABY7LFI9_9GAMM|nr:response regulator [Salinivibrio proteolyticus]WBA14941.1 response regulator [Salinivibrio proteolyticus]